MTTERESVSNKEESTEAKDDSTDVSPMEQQATTILLSMTLEEKVR